MDTVLTTKAVLQGVGGRGRMEKHNGIVRADLTEDGGEQMRGDFWRMYLFAKSTT